ncbi:unnamed protein product [Pleuronectes platessa]|uniref:Uncharacterized protein n=1 Tax=Pleuronectes platessa TaxID=8262 RepID=A0A9N7ZBA9_PLEPL|nr:unnamed protein product [Pleuronectes platessa]
MQPHADCPPPESLRGGRVLLVTGASTDVGEQLAYHHARLGAQIVTTTRRKDMHYTRISTPARAEKEKEKNQATCCCTEVFSLEALKPGRPLVCDVHPVSRVLQHHHPQARQEEEEAAAPRNDGGRMEMLLGRLAWRGDGSAAFIYVRCPERTRRGRVAAE